MQKLPTWSCPPTPCTSREQKSQCDPSTLLSPVLTLLFFGLTDEGMRFWCPSLQEVKEVFHSLGAYNPALYPQGPFQHSTRCVPPHLTAACDFSLQGRS